MERLECFRVLIHVICKVRVVLLYLLKKQGSNFSHRAHTLLRTYLTHAALFEHVKRSFLHDSYIWKQAIMPSGGTRLFQLGIGM